MAVPVHTLPAIPWLDAQIFKNDVIMILKSYRFANQRPYGTTFEFQFHQNPLTYCGFTPTRGQGMYTSREQYKTISTSKEVEEYID